MIIGIIGIGVIGSSLARALRARDAGDEILIADRAADSLRQAEDLRLGDRSFSGATELAPLCDILFVCVPVDGIVAVVRSLAPHIKPGAIVTDVGAVKSGIVEEATRLLAPRAHFIGGHPITADSEQGGPAAGRADLFHGKPYLLIDNPAAPDAQQKLAALLRGIGAEVRGIGAARHDQILAFTSHLPHLLAYAAMRAAPEASRRAGEDVKTYTGGSFRDLTRVAGAGSDVWASILLLNRAPLLEAYGILRQEIDRLISLVEKGDRDALKTYIDEAQALRLRHSRDSAKG